MSSGGTASGTVVSSGGAESVSSGGVASGSVIDRGTRDLLAGAIASGAITFGALSGTLDIGDTGAALLAGATISGFAAGNTIDLTAIAYDSDGTAILGSGNVLSVTENGHSHTLHAPPLDRRRAQRPGASRRMALYRREWPQSSGREGGRRPRRLSRHIAMHAAESGRCTIGGRSPYPVRVG